MNRKKLPWYRTIVVRLMLILTAALIPVLLISGGLYRMFQREMMENLAQNTLTRDEQIFQTFYARIEDAEYCIRDLYREDKVSYLSDMWEYYDSAERSQKIAGIQERMQWYQFIEGFITEISIYLPKRGICIRPGMWREMNEADAAAVAAYEENPEALLIERGNVQLYMGDLNSGIQAEEMTAICRMTLSMYQFQNLLSRISEDPMAEAMIFIDGGVLMDNIGDEALREALPAEYAKRNGGTSGCFSMVADHREYFCTFAGDPGHRIGVICSRPYDQMFPRNQESFFLMMAMVAVICLIVLLIFLYVQRYIRHPVVLLNQAFEQIRDGNEETRIREESGDEFEALYAGFNEMSERLTTNIRENYLAKIGLQREQLKQLQAQINPHFLYNTLLFIRIRIRKGDLSGAEKLTGLLSDYFRFINRNKRDVITLEEELSCIRTYMEIQTERFGSRCRFLMEECPKEIADIPVPRLLLQPLLENAVKYGMERIEENGWVKLSFLQEGRRVSVIVEEGGLLVSQEEIDALNERVRQPAGQAEVTSTINISQRIRLYYGEGYGLHYERTGEGYFRAIAELDGGKEDETVERDRGGR